MKKNIFSLVVIALLAISPIFAQHNHQHTTTPADDGHGHTADQLPQLSFSKIVDGYELYVAIPTLVHGEHIHFHTHITKLDEYKGADNAKATVKIGKMSTDEAVSKAGLTHMGLHIEESGVHPIIVEFTADGKTSSHNLGDITIYNSISEAFHAPKSEVVGEIQLAKKWMWNNPFGVEVIKSAPFNEIIKTRAEILPSTTSKAVIVAPTSGVVAFNKGVVAGRSVQQGVPFAYIKNGGLEDNITSRYQKLKSELELAKSNWERNKTLAEDKIVTEKALKESYNAYIKAQKDFQNLSKIYNKNGVKISSPSNAVITNILVSENQYVKAGDILAEVQQKNSNMLKVELPKYYYSKISKITDANFIPEYSDEVLTVSKLGGTKLINNISTIENSAYIPLYFSLPSNDKIVPYSYAEAFAIVGNRDNVISVPVEAIMENEGLYWVYVQTNGERFEKREVVVAESNGKRRVIKSGVHDGDIVVIKGAPKVRQCETSGVAIPHGHTH